MMMNFEKQMTSNYLDLNKKLELFEQEIIEALDSQDDEEGKASSGSSESSSQSANSEIDISDDKRKENVWK